MKKRKHRILTTLLVILLATTLIICGFIFVSGYLPVLRSNRRIDGLENYVRHVNEIEISDNVEIISLGEATHGNNELQLIKIEAFKHLVEKYNVKAFCLEADFGEGLLINDYIQNNNGTAIDAVKNLSFPIYHTKPFLELITWMHDYNLDKNDEDKLSFYGFDMQNPESSVEYLIKVIDDEQIKETLLPLASKDQKSLSDPKIEEGFYLIDEMKDSFEDELARKAAYNVMNAYEYYLDYSSDPLGVSKYRDKCMADNVSFILDYEKTKGNNRIFITGHNGHIARDKGSLSKGLYYDNMGKLLSEKYKDNYFAIGTDYHKSIRSARYGDTFKSFKVYSEDPFTTNAWRVSDGYYYLDFKDVKDENSDVYQLLNSHINVGSFEPSGYSSFYKLYFFVRPSLTRESIVLSNAYDAMIFFNQVNPLDLID